MRKLHRTLAVFFSPFLIVTAITGLLWAYAPHLYLKLDAPKKAPLSAQDAPRVSPVEALSAAGGAGAKVMSVTLRNDDGRLVYAVAFAAKGAPEEAIVDADTGKVLKAKAARYPEFHHWVMKLHRFEFFGTKKELTVFPGLGLLSMLLTGFFLFRYGLKK